MSYPDVARPRVVFATHAYEDARTGPAVYARYLWEAFRDDPDIEFHLVSPDGPGDHPRLHRFTPSGPGSRRFYAALGATALGVARGLGAPGIVHLNAPHYALLEPPAGWRLWLQLNDYEGAQLPSHAWATLRSAGPRRLASLMIRRWVERRMLRRCDLALANSDYTRHAVLEAYPELPAVRARTLHKAVDLGFFSGTRSPASPGGPRRLAFVGSNFRIKRLHLAVAAFARLPGGVATLRVAGCTREEFVLAHPELADAAANPAVRFLGRLGRDGVRNLLLDADTLLLPSRQEALGVAALEAVACGCRVIGANVGGIPEIVGHTDIGRLVDEATPAAWHAAIREEIAADSCLGPHRDALLARFSVQHMIGRLRDLYLTSPNA